MPIPLNHAGAGVVTLAAPSSGSYTLTLPSAVAAVNGYVLSSDTSGTLSWAAGGGAEADTLATVTGRGATTATAVSFGNVTLTTATEILNTKTAATGVVAHDYSTGSTWYHTSISANFTPNFTNVSTTDARTVVVNLILVQGATAYIPSALQVAGSSLTIKWVNGVTPSGNPNKVDIATFTLIRSGAAWAQALGSYASFG